MDEAVGADPDLVLADARRAVAVVAELQNLLRRRSAVQKPVFYAAVAPVAADAAFVLIPGFVGKTEADLDNRERRVGGRPAGIICLGDLAGRALPADRGGLRRIGCGQRRHGKQRQAGREEHGLHGG